MSSQLKTLGEIHGWLHTYFAHQMQYSGGKTLNKSGELVFPYHQVTPALLFHTKS
jgi:hypothetical protein